MFKVFFIQKKTALGPESTLSRFVYHASSAEKKRVYNKVIKQAVEEQNALLRSIPEHQKREAAHA